MAGGNLKKSRRIKARKKELCKNDLDSALPIDEHDFTKISNFTPSYQNGKRLPGGDKKHITKGRRVGRSKTTESSDENGHTILKSSAEIKNHNAKESKKGSSHSAQYQNGKSNMVLNSEKDLQLRVIVCDVCSKICFDQKAYSRHMKSHSVRKFKCDICEKTYTESCSLKRHKRTHGNDRPFHCDLCPKSFRDSSNLMRHQAIHTERQKMYHCSKCEKSFMDKHGLKRHEQLHTGIRPYSCKVCSKSFSDSGSLNRHQRIHGGVKNYSCSGCKKRFLEKQTLVRHQRNVCKFVDSTALMETSSFILDQSCESLYSGAEHSEGSECRVDDKGSIPPISVHLPKALPVLIPAKPLSVLSQLDYTGKTDTNKDLPSLHSLIKKDPNLYSSISELVESIDSYEKLLHLCGERGQNEIDAALAKDAAPLPENLLCFECGELLVEGENFTSQGKVFLASSSYRCLSCEEDCDYGDPPVLTPEVSPSEPLTPTSRCSEDKEMKCSYANQNENLYGGSESILALREKLQNGRAVDLIAHGLNGVSVSTFPDLNPSDTVKLKSQDKRKNRSHPLETSTDAGEETHKADCPTGASVDKGNQSTYDSTTAGIADVFPCHLCTEVFKGSVFLSQHLACHSSSPFTCMVCCKSFANSSSLRRHMTMHTGEKPYSCPNCRKHFRDPSNFSKHKKACAAFLTIISPESSNTSPQQSFKCMGNNETDQGNSPASASGSTSFLRSNQQRLKKGLFKDGARDDKNVNSPLSFEWKQEITCEAQSEKCEKVLKTIKEENLPVSCALCNKEFKNEKLLEMHMSYHSGNPNVTCIECGRSCSDSSSLKRHARLHAGIRPHICEYCHRGYCDNWSLKKHRARGCMAGELKVSVDSLHPCPQCTRVFSEAHFQREHVKCHKGILRFECDMCPKKFSEAFNLKRHRLLHMVSCSGCEQEFKDKSTLIEHKKVCPANDKLRFLNRVNGFPCPICGRAYATKSYLERHKKFHSDLKPHVCEVCGKRFSEGFRLKRHMKVHSGAKPFICDGCKKGFSDSLGLKRHRLSLACKYLRSQLHNGQQSPTVYSCQICYKIFQKNYLLVRHMAVHSLARPFPCGLCGKAYKDTSSLKRHQQVHSGVKTFVCSVCGKGFYYMDSLRRHKSGLCGQKSKSRRPEKSKKSSKTKSGRKDKDTHIELDNVNSGIDTPKDLNQHSALNEQITAAKGQLHEHLKVEFSNEFPPQASKENIFRSLTHPRHALQGTTKGKLHLRPAVHGRVKTSHWPKHYQCTSCFLSFNRKVYLALHYRAH